MKRSKLLALIVVLALVLLSACSQINNAAKTEPETSDIAADSEENGDEGSSDEQESQEESDTEEQNADAHEYTIYYYDDVDAAEPSDQTTTATYGTKTKLLTVKELGFSKDGKVFEGWRMRRDTDNKWYVRLASGKIRWTAVEDGELPEGAHWQLRKNGSSLIKPAKEGDVRLYAQWGGESFTVYYHEDEDSEASATYSVVPYGVKTEMISVSELGFEKEGKEFAGWKAYREIDNKWYAKNADGKARWVRLQNGELPDGFTWILFKDCKKLSKAATSGIVHVYAQWE